MIGYEQFLQLRRVNAPRSTGDMRAVLWSGPPVGV